MLSIFRGLTSKILHFQNLTKRDYFQRHHIRAGFFGFSQKHTNNEDIDWSNTAMKMVSDDFLSTLTKGKFSFSSLVKSYHEESGQDDTETKTYSSSTQELKYQGEVNDKAIIKDHIEETENNEINFFEKYSSGEYSSKSIRSSNTDSISSHSNAQSLGV